MAEGTPTSVRDDRDEYRFLVRDDAALDARLDDRDGHRTLLILGNRAGLLGLANLLLWFVANAWRREFLSLRELPFAAGAERVVLRLSMDDGDGFDGLLTHNGADEFEWLIAEDDLRRVAMMIHGIVSMPQHEYDRLRVRQSSYAEIEVRMSDVRQWL